MGHCKGWVYYERKVTNSLGEEGTLSDLYIVIHKGNSQAILHCLFYSSLNNSYLLKQEIGR